MNKIPMTLLTAVCVLATGCKTGSPTQPTTNNQPAQNRSAPVQAPTSSPKVDNCDAISDPVLAEDCRFDKKVAAARKKHNSSNVVKHSPGSIQQP